MGFEKYCDECGEKRGFHTHEDRKNKMTETWKDIKGFEGYQLSSEDRVRSKDRPVKTFMGKKMRKGKILKPSSSHKEVVYQFSRATIKKFIPLRVLKTMV